MKRIFTLLVMVTFGVVGLFAQLSNQAVEIDNPVWEKIVAANEGPNLSKFAEANGRMWTIEENGLLLFSDDNGQTWQLNPVGSSLKNQQIFAGGFGIILTRLFEEGEFTTYSSYYDIYYSEDNGESFIKRDANILKYSSSTHLSTQSHGLFRKSSSELIEISTTLAGGGPYYNLKNSTDSGLTWTVYNLFSGLTFDPISPMKFDVQNDTLSTLIQREDSTWFLNVYSDDYENPTILTFTIPEDISIRNFHFYNSQLNIFSGDARLFSSDDFGQTWNIYTYNIPGVSFFSNIKYGLNEIYFRSDSQLYSIKYDDLDNVELLFEFPLGHSISLTEASTGALVSIPQGVFLRTEEGQPFNLISNGFPGAATDFKLAGDVLWTKTKLWYRSEDQGVTWSLSPLNILENSKILTDYNNIFLLEKDNEIYQSINNGFTWEPIFTFQETIQIVEQENGVFLYDDFQIYFSGNGINYTEVTHPPGNGKFIWYQNHLLYFSDGQRYVSDDNGLNWEIPEPTQGANGGFIENNNNQLISIENIGCCSFIRHSNDGGFSWIENSFLYPLLFPYVDVVPQYAGHPGGIHFFNQTYITYVTADNGENWASIQTPFHYRASTGGFIDNWISGPIKTAQKGDYIYGIGESNGVYRTSLSFLKNQLPDSTVIKNQITGHLYKDVDNNCINDETDTPIANKVLYVGDKYLRTDDEGWYGLFYDFSNSEIPYHTDSIRHTEHNCEYSYDGVLQVDENANADTLDIAFYPIPGITDGGITAWTIGIFRPGENPQIKIKITNYGTVPLDNENILLSYNPSLQSISTNSAGMALGSDQWQIPFSLEPSASRTFFIRLDISTSATINDVLNYTINLPITNDAYLPDNQTTITENIVTSIDPNDKTAYEKTTLPYTQNEFIYRIRFQNTGNDTAFKVVILDTLPPALDIFTLEILDASHPYELKIHNPVLRWTFQDILLPDSTTNEADSHGYLFFKIKTKNDLVITDTIKNSAAIYFDYNDPIITEQAITEIEKGYEETDIFLSICDGNEIDGMIISMDTTIVTIDTTNQVYDLTTNTIIEVEPTYYIDSLLTLHPGDTILGVPIFGDTTIVYQGLTTQGCDSIISFQIDFLTSTADLNLLSFTAQVQPNPNMGRAVLILKTTESEQLNISLYNLTGQSVKTILNDKILSAGQHELPMSLDDLPSGVYWLRIQCTRGEKALRILRVE